MDLGTLAGGLGSFPLGNEAYPPLSHSRASLAGIRSLIGFGRLVRPPSPFSALPPSSATRGGTSIHFGENQLFPSLISLSLRSTAHPLNFQLRWVRPSTRFYPRFTLAMDRSPGFGSARRNYIALFRLGFPTAPPYGLTLLRHATRWLIMQKVRGHLAGLPLFVDTRFQGAISLPSRGSFHLSLTVLVHYRSVGST